MQIVLDPECYVCAEAGCVQHMLCNCKTLGLHLACQKKLIMANQSTTCRVCLTPYTNVRVKWTWRPTREGAVVATLLLLSFAGAALEASYCTLYPVDSVAGIIIIWSAVLLFIAFLAVLRLAYTRYQRGARFVIRTVRRVDLVAGQQGGRRWGRSRNRVADVRMTQLPSMSRDTSVASSSNEDA